MKVSHYDMKKKLKKLFGIKKCFMLFEEDGKTDQETVLQTIRFGLISMLIPLNSLSQANKDSSLGQNISKHASI